MGQTTFSGPVVSQNGFIENSFTTAERDALVNPQPGLLIYNTTTNTYQVCTVGGGTPTWDTAFGEGGGGGGTGPNITSVSPSSGVAGTNVTINGTGFDGTTSITFGGVSAGGFMSSATQLITNVPSGPTPGPVDVVVTTPLGSSTEVGGFTYTAPAATTYTEGVDYQPGGVTRTGMGSGTTIIINTFYWLNGNFNNIFMQGSGSTFTLVQDGVTNTVTTYTGWGSYGPNQTSASGLGSQYTEGGFQSSISFS
jgi:hypothetical protein